MFSRRIVIRVGLLATAGAFLGTQDFRAHSRLRIAVVSDPHHSIQDVGSKGCSQALPLVKQFVDFCNTRDLDAVVCTGDLIEEVDPATDIHLAMQLYKRFRRLRAPLHCVPGNHDVNYMGIDEWESIFGKGSFTSRSVDINGYHLVFFCPIAPGGPYLFSDIELEWLRVDLARTKKPTIIFTHVPICAGTLVDNGYFVPGSDGEWANAEAAKSILKASTTILVVQGHTHQNSCLTSDGIHYVTVPSLTERRHTDPYPSESFALIDIHKSQISISVLGRDTASYAEHVRG